MTKQLQLFEQRLDSKRALRQHLMSQQAKLTKQIIAASLEIIELEREKSRYRLRHEY